MSLSEEEQCCIYRKTDNTEQLSDLGAREFKIHRDDTISESGVVIHFDNCHHLLFALLISFCRDRKNDAACMSEFSCDIP